MCYKYGSGVRQIEDIFKNVYDEYYKKVCRAVYILAGPDAEDIAQEAFIKLYNAPPKNMDNLGAWVTRVAVNLAKNQIRSDAARTRREKMTLIEEAVHAEEKAISDMESEEVRKALEKLDARDRDVLVLKYSGYSYEEISKVLKLNKSSVGTIIARAQKRFKSVFEGGE